MLVAMLLPLPRLVRQFRLDSKQIRIGALIGALIFGAIVLIATALFVANQLFAHEPKPSDQESAHSGFVQQSVATTTEVPPQVQVSPTVEVTTNNTVVATSQITFPSGLTATLYPDGRIVDQNGFVRGPYDGYIVAAAASTYPCTFGINSGLLHVVADERLMGALPQNDTLPVINGSAVASSIYYVGWAAQTPTWGINPVGVTINRSTSVTVNGTQCVPERNVPE